MFSNKPPLTPVVTDSVQSTHQIDLVSLEFIPILREGKVYDHVLSVLDVFSRYLQLRPMAGKQSRDVVIHLKEIYR